MFSILAVVASAFQKDKEPDGFQKVASVSSLRIYPVKSCKPFFVNDAEIHHLGFKHDRQYVLINDKGNFMSIRRYPKMVLIGQTILKNCIRLQAPGMPRLELPLTMSKADGDHLKMIDVWRSSTEGVHVSDAVDEWFVKFLDVPGCKLYCIPSDGKPRCTNDKGSFYSEFSTRDNIMAFADGSPIMVLSEESVTLLNTQLKEGVFVENFRPNIVLKGCLPHQENDWQRIYIGETVLKRLYPCVRCIATTVHPTKAEKNREGEPLKTLKQVRAAPDDIWPSLEGGPIFGCNYGVEKMGRVRVGDSVYIEK